MLPAMLVEPRELLLDGAFNLRDLGGLPAADGRTVRRCTVYRSGERPHLGPDGFEAVRRLGPCRRHRPAHQAGDRVPSRLGVLKVTYSHVSLVEAAVGESGAYPPDMPEDWLRRRYEEIVDTRGAGGSSAHPAELAGCDPSDRAVLGRKDRAGVVSALLLALLGMPDVPTSVLAARPETMVQFLTSLCGRHGSIEGLTLHTGVGPDAVARLRSLLLE